jgi:hypothetical protein
LLIAAAGAAHILLKVSSQLTCSVLVNMTLLLVLQLYVPRIPGMADFDERLVPAHWGFEEEVRRAAVVGG